jgi:hypothetical protein
MFKVRDNQRVIGDELLKRIEQWETQRPSKPYSSKPTYVTAYETGMLFGAFYPFAALGFLAGIFTWGMNQPMDETNIAILAAPLWMPFAFGFGGPIAVGFVYNLTAGIIYLLMRKVWRKYETELNDWRQAGMKEFKTYQDYPAVRMRIKGY